MKTPRLKIRRRTLPVVTGAAAALAVLGLVAGAARAGTPASQPTLQINLHYGLDYVDPGLAYYVPSWQLLQATCAKLVNYADVPGRAKLVPEVAAASPQVSTDRRTYRFSIQPGFRFSPPSNEPVTAATFKATFERSLSPALHSPARAFAHDLVGGDAYMAGAANSISGITASADTLTIRLTHPAGDFLARLAMPFFCAVPTNAPRDPNGSVLPSAGPYYIASYDPNGLTVLKVNPNYTGPRPHFFDEIDFHVNVDPAVTEAEIIGGSTDYAADGLPAANYGAIGAAYGLGSPAADAGHQQFFVNPMLETSYLALNTSRPPFSNPLLRQAVNYAIDRPALAATVGAYGATLTDQVLPPGMPGYRPAAIYPLAGPDLARARALAAASGATPATAELYTSFEPRHVARAQVIKADLAAIGITVNIHEFPTGVMYTKLGTQGEPFNIGDVGWTADYGDPADFMRWLLDGNSIAATNNNNLPYFNDPFYNWWIEAANTLPGDARFNAYAWLDRSITRNAAPWVAWSNDNSRDFFSARIGCQTYQAVTGMDIAALCLR